MNLFNRTLDFYWSVKNLIGKTIEEKGDNVEDQCSQLKEINSRLKYLEKFMVQLKMIESKQDLLTKIMGYMLEVIKVAVDNVTQVQ